MTHETIGMGTKHVVRVAIALALGAASCGGSEGTTKVSGGELERGQSKTVTARVTTAEVDSGDRLLDCGFVEIERARKDPPESEPAPDEIGLNLDVDVDDDASISGADECSVRLRVTAFDDADLGDYLVFVRITYQYADAGSGSALVDDSPGQIRISIVP